MCKHFNNYATLFVLFIIGTLFAQSLFQYPLWYAYFFLNFILLLSLNIGQISFNNSKIFKGISSIIFIGFLYLFSVSYQTYIDVLNYTTTPKTIDEYKGNITNLIEIVNNNVMWQYPALMVLDNYIQPGSPQINEVLSISDQLKYIDMLANELPYPGAIFKQIIIHKLTGDENGSIYYANLLAHGYPYFKEQFATQLEQSSLGFEIEVKIIRDFKYEDKSIFTNKIFTRKVN